MNLNRERMLARVRKQAQRAFPVLAQCAGCCEPATQRHHDDYSKPLEITPYCQQCQTDWHVKRGTWGRMKRTKCRMRNGTGTIWNMADDRPEICWLCKGVSAPGEG